MKPKIKIGASEFGTKNFVIKKPAHRRDSVSRNINRLTENVTVKIEIIQ